MSVEIVESVEVWECSVSCKYLTISSGQRLKYLRKLIFDGNLAEIIASGGLFYETAFWHLFYVVLFC